MISRRGFLVAGGALIVGLGLEGPDRLLAQTVANVPSEKITHPVTIKVLRPKRSPA